jgi:hypothetical protein
VETNSSGILKYYTMEYWKTNMIDNKRNRLESDLQYLENVHTMQLYDELSNITERDVKRRILDIEEELESLNK